MKKLTATVILELVSGGLALIGATYGAISATFDKQWIGVCVGLACVFLGWAAFTISQIQEK